MKIPMPTDIEKAFAAAHEKHRQMHFMNQENSMIKGCTLGTVFMYNGFYHVYVGVNGRNRKFPCIAYRVEDGTLRKMQRNAFAAVRRASVEDRR